MEPADLTDMAHINPTDPWLAQWMNEMGVELPAQPVRPAILLDSQTSEGTATMAGRGFGMLTPFFWRWDLTEGRLVRPFGHVSSRGWAYWLVCPEHRRAVPKIKRFCEWLLPTARSDHEAASAAGLVAGAK